MPTACSNEIPKDSFNDSTFSINSFAMPNARPCSIPSARSCSLISLIALHTFVFPPFLSIFIFAPVNRLIADNVSLSIFSNAGLPNIKFSNSFRLLEYLIAPKNSRKSVSNLFKSSNVKSNGDNSAIL